MSEWTFNNCARTIGYLDTERLIGSKLNDKLKINSKQIIAYIIELNINLQTVKLLQENTEEGISDQRVGKYDFGYYQTKVRGEQ